MRKGKRLLSEFFSQTYSGEAWILDIVEERIQDKAQLDFILIRNFKHGTSRKRHFRKGDSTLKCGSLRSLSSVSAETVFSILILMTLGLHLKRLLRNFSLFSFFIKKWGYRVVLGALRMGNNLIR